MLDIGMNMSARPKPNGSAIETSTNPPVPAPSSTSTSEQNGSTSTPKPKPTPAPPLEWDWDIEHADRKREAQADAALHGATHFEVDRRILKDVVLEHMKTPVARIEFLSAGTFHKAYLITLTTSHQLIARVARRFMPRLKTESEVATLRFLKERTGDASGSNNTQVPVPEVVWYDSNPYNRLGGEWILMSKAPGIPLSQVYHSLSYTQLVRLFDSLARLVIPLFGHRFSRIGSLYLGPDPTLPTPASALPAKLSSPLPSNAPTPTLTRNSTLTMTSLSSAFSRVADLTADTPRANHAQEAYAAFPFTPTLTPRSPLLSASLSRSGAATSGAEQESSQSTPQEQQYHVGPIISWPFFGSFRGDLPSAPPPSLPSSNAYVPRGPWPATAPYLTACITRELLAVQRENAGSAAGHRLHLDPAEIRSSWHHAIKVVEGDESDESDEWGLEESEDEWEGPGDVMYRDYRRGQRGAFLVAHTQRREECVKAEMARWREVVERLEEEWRRETERAGVGWGAKTDGGGDGKGEEFALDAHDLSLENVFVDPEDPAVITCIIDWESTTTRPLWAAAHLPAFLQSSPFPAKLFREAVARLADPMKVVGERRASDSKGKVNGKGAKPAAATVPANGKTADTAPSSTTDRQTQSMARLAREWLHHECTGMRLRMAHRVVEWDGWEEGLVDSILGPEEVEGEWFHHEDEDDDGDDEDDDADHDGHEDGEVGICVDVAENGNGDANGCGVDDGERLGTGLGIGKSLSRRRDSDPDGTASAGAPLATSTSKGRAAAPNPKPKPKGGATTGKPARGKRFAKNLEREKEQTLEITGDICGGRGGELGRRLEAWLTHSENNSADSDDDGEEGIAGDGDGKGIDGSGGFHDKVKENGIGGGG